MSPFWSCPVSVGRLKKPPGICGLQRFLQLQCIFGIYLHPLGPKYDHLKCSNKILIATSNNLTQQKHVLLKGAVPFFQFILLCAQVFSLCLLCSAALALPLVQSHQREIFIYHMVHMQMCQEKGWERAGPRGCWGVETFLHSSRNSLPASQAKTAEL